jgi:hypothetical protein
MVIVVLQQALHIPFAADEQLADPAESDTGRCLNPYHSPMVEGARNSRNRNV